jgi:hypothetical protein
MAPRSYTDAAPVWSKRNGQLVIMLGSTVSGYGIGCGNWTCRQAYAGSRCGLAFVARLHSSCAERGRDSFSHLRQIPPPI